MNKLMTEDLTSPMTYREFVTRMIEESEEREDKC